MTEYVIKRADEDITRLENWAWNTDESHYPTLTYEEGIKDALSWLFGKREDNPADD